MNSIELLEHHHFCCVQRELLTIYHPRNRCQSDLNFILKKLNFTKLLIYSCLQFEPNLLHILTSIAVLLITTRPKGMLSQNYQLLLRVPFCLQRKMYSASKSIYEHNNSWRPRVTKFWTRHSQAKHNNRDMTK